VHAEALAEGLKLLLINNYVKNRMKFERLLDKIYTIMLEKPDIMEFNSLDTSSLKNYDAVILSGTDSTRGLPEVLPEYGKEAGLIRNYGGPIFGICFGHQLISTAFGGRVLTLSHKYLGFHKVEVLRRDRLFEGLPSLIRVYEAHARVVERVPPGFIHLAKAKDYDVEVIRHKNRPIYGVQFHPERYCEEYPDGRRILENFLKISGWNPDCRGKI